MQDQEVGARAGRDRVGAALIVTELHQQGLVVKLLHDRAHLPPCKLPRGEVLEQCDHVKKRWPVALCALLRLAHSTQHVTNLGTFSPARMIQIVLTTALFPCRLM